MYFYMWVALPNFSQISQTIWNMREEIHLCLSVKCVSDYFHKIQANLTTFCEKTTIPNFMQIHRTV